MNRFGILKRFFEPENGVETAPKTQSGFVTTFYKV